MELVRKKKYKNKSKMNLETCWIYSTIIRIIWYFCTITVIYRSRRFCINNLIWLKGIKNYMFYSILKKSYVEYTFDGLAHVFIKPSIVLTMKQSFLKTSEVRRSLAIRLHISGSIIWISSSFGQMLKRWFIFESYPFVLLLEWLFFDQDWFWTLFDAFKESIPDSVE